MKRLLCVLMVMVMAVLLVPGAMADLDGKIAPRAVPQEGGTVSGIVTWLVGEHSITLNDLNAQANSGYKFVRWELTVIERGGVGQAFYIDIEYTAME